MPQNLLSIHLSETYTLQDTKIGAKSNFQGRQINGESCRRSILNFSPRLGQAAGKEGDPWGRYTRQRQAERVHSLRTPPAGLLVHCFAYYFFFFFLLDQI